MERLDIKKYYNLEIINRMKMEREQSVKALKKKKFFGLVQGAVELKDGRLEVTKSQIQKARKEMEREFKQYPFLDTQNKADNR